MKRFCGFITGFIFFIGGIFKLMDPVGAGLVMKEYFEFLHIGFMDFAAKPAGVLIAFLETAIGTALVTGIWRRLTAISALVLQGFFTILTLFLVIFNPEMDCGCFGEAIHLTHLQTFLKNIVICILLVIYIFPMKALGWPLKKKYVTFVAVMVSVAAFTVYSWIYIPLVDFTEFKPSAALQAGNAFDTAEEDTYEAVFIYEKDGIQERFDLDHLPDSTWTFVSTETVMKEESGLSTINLSFYGQNGEYLDELAAEGKVMVVSVYDPDMSAKKWNRIENFIRRSQEAGLTTLLLTTTTEGVPAGMAASAFISDYKTLISLNRSNGGVTYFNDGELVRKWARANAPSKTELDELQSTDATEIAIAKDSKGSLGFQGFLLYVFAVMLLL